MEFLNKNEQRKIEPFRCVFGARLHSTLSAYISNIFVEKMGKPYNVAKKIKVPARQ